MSGLAQFQQGAVRLKLLELLARAGGYELNDQVLQAGLASMGLRISPDQVVAELGWLEELSMVSLLKAGPLLIAELTPRGHSVAKGLSQVRGIDRPLPGSGL